MRRWTPWTVALVAAGIAAAVLLWRQIEMGERIVRGRMAQVASETMALLAADPLAMRADTQRLVRLTAAAAEAGYINSPEARYALAMQYQRENHTDAAEALLRRIIEERPDWSWPYAQLGSLLGRDGPERLVASEAMLREAVRLAPDWARPYNSLAVVLRLQGRYEEAEDAARFALELAPDDIAAHNNYANLLVTLERYEEALPHYEYAARLEPDNPKPVYNLACLYSVMGLEDEALEYLAFAIALSGAMRRDAALDPYFDNLRRLPDFQQLLYDAVNDDLSAPDGQ